MGSRVNTHGPGGPVHGSTVVKMKGLPFSITEREVREFFGDLRVRRVAFVMEEDGRPSGMVRRCTDACLRFHFLILMGNMRVFRGRQKMRGVPGEPRFSSPTRSPRLRCQRAFIIPLLR